MCACVLRLFSQVQLFVTLWTVAHQAPLSLGFSRQECCSGLPFPSAGDLPDPGIKPKSPMSPELAGGFFTTRVTWEACNRLSPLRKNGLNFHLVSHLAWSQSLLSAQSNKKVHVTNSLPRVFPTDHACPWVKTGPQRCLLREFSKASSQERQVSFWCS